MSSQRSAGTSRALSGKAIVGIILAVLALIFVVTNTGAGTIQVLFWSIAMPTWVWILLVLAVGVTIGSLFPWFRPRKK